MNIFALSDYCCLTYWTEVLEFSLMYSVIVKITTKAWSAQIHLTMTSRWSFTNQKAPPFKCQSGLRVNKVPLCNHNVPREWNLPKEVRKGITLGNELWNREHSVKWYHGGKISWNCNFMGLLHHPLWLNLVYTFSGHHFQLLKSLCFAKDHWWGFITRNAHMVNIVYWVRIKVVYTS